MFPETACENSGSPGKCTLLDQCQVAFEQVKKQRYHDFARCGFEGRTEIVCCPINKPIVSAKSKQACQRWTRDATIAAPFQISNGKNAEKGEFPHMAALGFYSEADRVYRFNCGGSLISEHYILTAAHCIANLDRNEVKIARIGTLEVPESVTEPNPAMDYNVANVKVHEQYIRKPNFNDIALVKLQNAVSFSQFIKPACLYLKNDDPEKLFVTGWGDLGLGLSRSKILQKAALRPESLTQCNVTYIERTKTPLKEAQICASDLTMDACQGDSGGPLQIPEPNTSIYAIVGVVSFGIGCGGRYPGVYARVYSYLDWIENIVWP